MAHTLDAVIYDPNSLIVYMVIIPDDDRELTDPSFNPPGLTQIKVPHLDGASSTDIIATVQQITGQVLIVNVATGES